MIGGPFPTSLKLRLVDADPFSNQANRSSWKLAIEDGPVKSHPSHLAAVSGVKMRRVVIAEEHQNRNPVEGADPGHGVNVSARTDKFDTEAHMGRILHCPPTSPLIPFPGRARPTRFSRCRG